MLLFLKKYWVHAVGGAFVFVVVLILALVAALSALQSGWGLGSASHHGFLAEDMAYSEPAFTQSAPAVGRAMLVEGDALESGFYPEPVPPTGDGAISTLEAFETTTYNLSSRSRDFDALCDTLAGLKVDESIHFKYLNSSDNHCSARFFTPRDGADAVLGQFEAFGTVEITRYTESVTRHQEQIESRTSIVTKQLASVERTLAEAEVAYDEIVAFARTNRDAATLSEAIRQKLQQIDYLTNRKISLTSQLDNLAQQAADLDERLDVIEFSASFSRSNPVDPGKHERLWETAIEELGERFTMTLIGVSVFFGVFLLYVVQYGLYLVVLIVAARFGWKFIRRVWRW